MNIFDVFKELEKDSSKKFTNDGYIICMEENDTYEFTIMDIQGNTIICNISNWRKYEHKN
jgi:hypothetical protein